MNWILSVLQYPLRRRQRVRALQRPSQTREEFVAQATSEGARGDVAGLLWDHVSTYVADVSLTPALDDDIEDTYLLHTDDRDEMIVAVCQGIGLPPETPCLDPSRHRLKTLRDVVRMITDCSISARKS